MNDFKHMLEVSAAAKEAYSAGHAAGWQEALLKVQSELAEVALESLANRNESRPENFVIMLWDVDKVINKMLHLDTLETG
jgi:hypothetical protein